MYWTTRTTISCIISNINRHQKESSWESLKLLIKDIPRKKFYTVTLWKKVITKDSGDIQTFNPISAWLALIQGH